MLVLRPIVQRRKGDYCRGAVKQNDLSNKWKALGKLSSSSSQFLAKDGIRINKVDELCYMIEKNTARGMRVPVKIYADDQLVSSMIGDRTIGQAVNVAALPGAQKHVVVLPDGHEGYGFPIGGVAATDLEEGVVG
jgi:tRNA-splicing ligase RtcB